MKKIWFAVLLSVSLVACRKEHVDPINTVNNTYRVTVKVDQSQPGKAISPTFEGLSFETAILTRNPEYLDANNIVLIQLLKNLGPGILRIGGDTSDEIDWTGNARSFGTSKDSLTTSDIDRLSAFSKAIGWPVLFGLNMGSNDVNAASNEARYAYNSLGSNLYAFQSGNEPDIYHMFGLRSASYNVNNYINDWDTYYAAIINVVPQASFAGPDVANSTSWLTSFAYHRSNNVKLLDAHYYLEGPASSAAIKYWDLLATNYYLSAYLSSINVESSKYGLPYRITECNNIYGGGKAGASDVFASALWALNFMWAVAENKGQGVNFHDGHGLIYSPITMSSGILTAHPEYYAMLAFKYGSTGGTIIPATISDQTYNCGAHACALANNTWSVTLINEEESKDINYTVQLSKSASLINVARLTAPDITSVINVTFAGSTVQADGTFKPGNTEQRKISQNSFDVKVPAGSAAVVTIQ
jgi:hypothetical protein